MKTRGAATEDIVGSHAFSPLNPAPNWGYEFETCGALSGDTPELEPRGLIRIWRRQVLLDSQTHESGITASSLLDGHPHFGNSHAGMGNLQTLPELTADED